MDINENQKDILLKELINFTEELKIKQQEIKNVTQEINNLKNDLNNTNKEKNRFTPSSAHKTIFKNRL